MKEDIYSMIFFKNIQNYFSFINIDKIKIGRLNNDEGLCIKECNETFINKIKVNNGFENLILSEDENIIVLVNGNSFILYLIKNN